jgi:hypothetical protein
LSLHDGFAWLWWGRRIKVGDAECAQHGGSALGAAVDDAHRFERVESVGGREIEARGLELLFDCAMDEEGERGTRWSMR